MDYKSFLNEAEAIAYEVFLDLTEDINEGKYSGSVDNPNSAAHKSLKKKAEKSGFPLGILKQVFKRGKSAWKVGHRPGTTPEQWAHGRVNSFIVGGRTTEVGDKALYQKAKKSRAKKRKKK